MFDKTRNSTKVNFITGFWNCVMKVGLVLVDKN